MKTVRSLLLEANAFIENDCKNLAWSSIEDALKLLDESETAWRNDGSTYRLVEDEIEVPA